MVTERDRSALIEQNSHERGESTRPAFRVDRLGGTGSSPVTPTIINLTEFASCELPASLAVRSEDTANYGPVHFPVTAGPGTRYFGRTAMAQNFFTTRVPKLCRHRRKNRADQAFVTVGGERTYLGPFGSPESAQRYTQILAELDAHGGTVPPPAGDCTVAELAALYLDHADGYYRHADGTPTGEAENIRLAMRPLVELYGESDADDFTPQKLKAVRSTVVRDGLARNTVNERTRRIKRLFRWAVSEGLVVPSVYDGLRTVDGLRRGRSGARETDPIRPVPEAHVEAAKALLPTPVRALVDLLRFTGARAGEFVGLRPCDIDTTGSVWLYEPDRHKSAHHGRRRFIAFGPRAQAVLRPFLVRPPTAPPFSPVEAEEERLRARHETRVVPLAHGNRPGTNRRRNPRRKPREMYTVHSLRRAIHRACDRAGVPRWSPHRLRHSFGTEIRRRYGVEAARAALGHSAIRTTEIYCEMDMNQTIEIAEQLG